jgi:hypothetical protein
VGPPTNRHAAEARPTRESIQRNAKDVLAGLLFAGFGLFFAVGALSYPIGSAARMGPGFFPLLAGVVLVALGVLTAVKPVEVDGDDSALTRPDVRALVLIPLAIMVFGLTVRGLGLVPSLLVTVLIAASASRQARPFGALLLAVALTVISILIFVVALRLNLPLVGPWIPRL